MGVDNEYSIKVSVLRIVLVIVSYALETMVVSVSVKLFVSVENHVDTITNAGS